MASARLNGTLVDDGGEACDCGFEWGMDTSYGFTTPTTSEVTGGTFSQVITGLNPGTTYHFRAFATNSVGTSYGADRSFTTSTPTPTIISVRVMTMPATNVSEYKARLNGLVVDDGGIMGDVRFQWGLMKTYGNDTIWQQGYVSGNEFYVDLSTLTEGMGYHFRAQFRNRLGIVSGADMVFNTLSLLGAVTLIEDELVYLLEASR